MTPGASIYSVAATATWAMITGSADANYPVTNLNNLKLPSKVARLTAAGGVIAASFDLSAAASVGFVALCRHTFQGAETIRVRLYSAAGLGGSNVYDSGVVSVWSAGAFVSGYSPTRPFVLTANVTALSGRIDIASAAGAYDIGAVEIAQWFPWYIAPGLEQGFDTRAVENVLVGGGAEAGDILMPRTASGVVDFMALATAQTTGLDFQKTLGKAKPFVYVADADDGASWARACYLAVNQELPPIVGALYRHDRFPVRVREYMR